MKKIRIRNLVSLVSAGLLLASCSAPEFPSENPVAPGSRTDIELTDYSSYNISAANVSKDFMRGVDASEVKALEECGQKFYNEDNTEKDVFAIFAEHGVNWIRLRIWNDYTQALNDSWGPYGYNNLSRTINMAQRAKKYGMKVLLDFHYSDSWADPNSQKCPEMWKDITSKEDLADAVADYTSQVLQEMIQQNCAPDMIQLGNEMQGGLFQTNSALTNAKNYTAEYLTAAAKVVKNLLPDCRLMLHMSNGDKASYADIMINYATQIGKDAGGKSYIDTIGVSYYTFFHGTDTALKTNLNKIKAAGFTTVIAENSFAYSTTAYTDSTSNEFWEDDEESAAAKLTLYKKGSGITENSSGKKVIEATISNQAGVIQYLMELTSSVDPAGGYFYWGGCYLGIEGTMNSSWENQALFDVHGKVLPSINAYNVK